MKKRNIMKELREIKDKKDKRDLIKELLRRHEDNVNRKKMIEYHNFSDEETLIGGVDYSAVKVQTSGISDLSNIPIQRENELEALNYEIGLVERLVDSIRGRKKDRNRIIINHFYIQGRKKESVMDEVFMYDPSYFNKICNGIIDDMLKTLE